MYLTEPEYSISRFTVALLLLLLDIPRILKNLHNTLKAKSDKVLGKIQAESRMFVSYIKTVYMSRRQQMNSIVLVIYFDRI